MKIQVNQDYAALRRKAYPSLADQLDAVWKALAALPGKQAADVQAVMDQVAAVKTRYPKK